MTTLYLPDSVRRQLEAWTAQGYPYETCGVLVGTQQEGEVRVQRAVQARNLNTGRARDRYDLAMDDYAAAEDAAVADGLDIVGIWHSHPDHPARPSETDRQRAWGGWSYVIVAVHQGQAVDLRSWRLAGDHFTEESIAPWPT
ncbi:MAG: M67 family metallopeptidase [Pseudomonadota bacterium]|nr:M67 family metallopeptidase [Pseudomonadota bacterium]